MADKDLGAIQSISPAGFRVVRKNDSIGCYLVLLCTALPCMNNHTVSARKGGGGIATSKKL